VLNNSGRTESAVSNTTMFLGSSSSQVASGMWLRRPSSVHPSSGRTTTGEEERSGNAASQWILSAPPGTL